MQNDVDVIDTKSVERCYDLDHADGCKDHQYAQTLAQESLEIDLPIAKQFFSDTLAQQLESAALHILK